MHITAYNSPRNVPAALSGNGRRRRGFIIERNTSVVPKRTPGWVTWDSTWTRFRSFRTFRDSTTRGNRFFLKHVRRTGAWIRFHSRGAFRDQNYRELDFIISRARARQCKLLKTRLWKLSWDPKDLKLCVLREKIFTINYAKKIKQNKDVIIRAYEYYKNRANSIK